MSDYNEKKKKFIWSKEVTIELIELYQNHPVLYIVSDQNYKNKNVRQAALEYIRRELMKLEFCSNQCLDINDIKTKIHTLRTQFFKEWGKVKASESSEAGPDSVYQPKLWCYEELAFLRELEYTTQNFTYLDEQLETKESAGFGDTSEDMRTNGEETIEIVTEPSISPRKRRKVQREVAKFLSAAATSTSQQDDNDESFEKDDIHTFAMSVAAELRKIKNPRRLVQLKRNIFNRILEDQEEEISIDDDFSEMN